MKSDGQAVDSAVHNQFDLFSFAHTQRARVIGIQRQVRLRRSLRDAGRQGAQFLRAEDVIERRDHPLVVAPPKRIGRLVEVSLLLNPRRLDQSPARVAAASTAVALEPTTRPRPHRHLHHHVATVPADPFPTYGRATAFGVGMLHGIGAETPTQVIVFAAAAGAGGAAAGILVLAVFLLGLVASNTVVALAATFGFLGAARNFRVYAAISIVTAVFSLLLGALLVLGRSAALPAILGG